MAGTTVNPYRFGGQLGYRRDGPNRLYIRERHIDTSRGRWLSRDPIALVAADFNFYWYVKNNSVNYIDTDGNAPQKPHPHLGVPTSLKGCLSHQAQKNLLKKLNNAICAAAIKAACKESGLAALNDPNLVPSWEFPQPTPKNPTGSCSTKPVLSTCSELPIPPTRRNPSGCKPTGICISHSTCTDPDPNLGPCAVIWEISNACDCKYNKYDPGEAVARRTNLVCGCSKENGPGGIVP